MEYSTATVASKLSSCSNDALSAPCYFCRQSAGVGPEESGLRSSLEGLVLVAETGSNSFTSKDQSFDHFDDAHQGLFGAFYYFTRPKRDGLTRAATRLGR